LVADLNPAVPSSLTGASRPSFPSRRNNPDPPTPAIIGSRFTSVMEMADRHGIDAPREMSGLNQTPQDSPASTAKE
jgi:hypothetical protein